MQVFLIGFVVAPGGPKEREKPGMLKKGEMADFIQRGGETSEGGRERPK